MQNTYQNGPKEGAPTERFFEWAHAFGKPQRQPLCSSGSNEVVRVTDNLQTNPAKGVACGPTTPYMLLKPTARCMQRGFGETLE